MNDRVVVYMDYLEKSTKVILWVIRFWVIQTFNTFDRHHKVITLSLCRFYIKDVGLNPDLILFMLCILREWGTCSWTVVGP